jgi:hypothetical protein
MMGHQAIGVNATAIRPCLLTQILQIAVVIRFGIKTGLPVIPPLDDRPGNARHGQTYYS